MTSPGTGTLDDPIELTQPASALPPGACTASEVCMIVLGLQLHHYLWRGSMPAVPLLRLQAVVHVSRLMERAKQMTKEIDNPQRRQILSTPHELCCGAETLEVLETALEALNSAIEELGQKSRRPLSKRVMQALLLANPSTLAQVNDMQVRSPCHVTETTATGL